MVKNHPGRRSFHLLRPVYGPFCVSGHFWHLRVIANACHLGTLWPFALRRPLSVPGPHHVSRLTFHHEVVNPCNCNTCETCKTCNHILSQKLATFDFARCPRPSPCSKLSQNHPPSAVCPGPLSQSAIGSARREQSPIPPGPRPFCNRQFFPFPRIRVHPCPSLAGRSAAKTAVVKNSAFSPRPPGKNVNFYQVLLSFNKIISKNKKKSIADNEQINTNTRRIGTSFP